MLGTHLVSLRVIEQRPRTLPDFYNEEAVMMKRGANSFSAEVCTFYQKGMCKYGKGCKFAHVKASSNGMYTIFISMRGVLLWQNHFTHLEESLRADHIIGNTPSDAADWRSQFRNNQISMPQSANPDNDFVTGSSKATEITPDFTVLPREDR